MTAPMSDGQPLPDAAPSLSEEFEVLLSETLPDGLMDVIEAVHEITSSPLEQAEEHFEAVNELQMESVEALMHDDPDTAQALLAEADGHLRDAADVLDNAD